jgi:hypothetical protein
MENFWFQGSPDTGQAAGLPRAAKWVLYRFIFQVYRCRRSFGS